MKQYITLLNFTHCTTFTILYLSRLTITYLKSYSLDLLDAKQDRARQLIPVIARIIFTLVGKTQRTRMIPNVAVMDTHSYFTRTKPGLISVKWPKF